MLVVLVETVPWVCRATQGAVKVLLPHAAHTLNKEPRSDKGTLYAFEQNRRVTRPAGGFPGCLPASCVFVEQLLAR